MTCGTTSCDLLNISKRLFKSKARLQHTGPRGSINVKISNAG